MACVFERFELIRKKKLLVENSRMFFLNSNVPRAVLVNFQGTFLGTLLGTLLGHSGNFLSGVEELVSRQKFGYILLSNYPKQ